MGKKKTYPAGTAFTLGKKDENGEAVMAVVNSNKKREMNQRDDCRIPLKKRRIRMKRNSNYGVNITISNNSITTLLRQVASHWKKPKVVRFEGDDGVPGWSEVTKAPPASGSYLYDLAYDGGDEERASTLTGTTTQALLDDRTPLCESHFFLGTSHDRKQIALSYTDRLLGSSGDELDQELHSLTRQCVQRQRVSPIPVQPTTKTQQTWYDRSTNSVTPSPVFGMDNHPSEVTKSSSPLRLTSTTVVASSTKSPVPSSNLTADPPLSSFRKQDSGQQMKGHEQSSMPRTSPKKDAGKVPRREASAIEQSLSKMNQAPEVESLVPILRTEKVSADSLFASSCSVGEKQGSRNLDVDKSETRSSVMNYSVSNNAFRPFFPGYTPPFTSKTLAIIEDLKKKPSTNQVTPLQSYNSLFSPIATAVSTVVPGSGFRDPALGSLNDSRRRLSYKEEKVEPE